MKKREIEECITLIKNTRDLYITQLKEIQQDKDLEPIRYDVIGRIRLYDIILIVLEAKIR